VREQLARVAGGAGSESAFAVERTILTPEAVSRVVERALQLAKEGRKQEPDTTKTLEAEIQRLEHERDTRGRVRSRQSSGKRDA
jgi:hypothetical protein